MSLLLDRPQHRILTTVCCLRCGEERPAAQAPTAARGITPAECARCGYLGWREVDDLGLDSAHLHVHH